MKPGSVLPEIVGRPAGLPSTVWQLAVIYGTKRQRIAFLAQCDGIKELDFRCPGKVASRKIESCHLSSSPFVLGLHAITYQSYMLFHSTSHQKAHNNNLQWFFLHFLSKQSLRKHFLSRIARWRSLRCFLFHKVSYICLEREDIPFTVWNILYWIPPETRPSVSAGRGVGRWSMHTLPSLRDAP